MKRTTRVLCIAVAGLAGCKFPYPPDLGADGQVDSRPGDGATPEVPTIAFTSNRAGNDELYVACIDGSMPVNLTNNPASDVHPLWSPTGDRIAFLSDRGGVQELYGMRADGAGLMNVSRGQAAEPVWSPDGLRMAFASTRTGNAELYRVRLDGSAPERMSFDASGSSYLQVDWSPAGTTLIYTTGTTLALINADGSGRRPIGNGLFISARWNRHGDRLAILQRPMLFYEVYLASGDGSNSVNLTNTSQQHERDPQWSPDGSRLAVVGGTAANSEIEILGVTTGARVNRSMTPADDVHPRWSPDGTLLLFGSQGDIFSVSAAGGGITNITNDPGTDSDAEWKPLP